MEPRLSRQRTRLEFGGALGGTRTHDLILRRDALYPSELQARAGAEGGTRTHTPC